MLGWLYTQGRDRTYGGLATTVDLVVVIGPKTNRESLRSALDPLIVEEVPPVYVDPCPLRASARAAHERGVTLAHRAVWKEAHRRGCRKTLIFEGDAVPVSKSARASVERASQAGTDIFYLGWCYGNLSQPLCTHAYMLSAKAVKILLGLVPEEGCAPDGALPPLDHLLRIGVQRYGLSWELAPDPDDAPSHWTKGPFHQDAEEDPDS